MKVKKTILFKIDNPNKEKLKSLDRILEIYKLSLCFYLKAIIELGKYFIACLPRKAALSYLEKNTIPTKKHPKVKIKIPKGIQTNIRRSAINKAVGMVKSYLSNLFNFYQQRKEKRGKKPHYPTPETFTLTYYATDISLKDIKKSFVRLKVVNEKGKYEHKNYPILLYKRALDYLNSLEWKLLPTGTLIKKGEEYFLGLVFEKEVKKCTKIDYLIGVDLNLARNVYTAVVIDKKGDIKRVKFGNGNLNKLKAKRDKIKKVILEKIRRTGGNSIQRGKSFCKRLWLKIKRLNREISHIASKELINLAKNFINSVVIFEKIKHFKAKKGKYSKKHNEKLNYWLKNSLVNYFQYKANVESIRKTSENPYQTSERCSRCGSLKTERFSEGKKPSTALFRCKECGYSYVNADFNAAVNIAIGRWWAICSSLNAQCGGAKNSFKENFFLVSLRRVQMMVVKCRLNNFMSIKFGNC